MPGIAVNKVVKMSDIGMWWLKKSVCRRARRGFRSMVVNSNETKAGIGFRRFQSRESAQ